MGQTEDKYQDNRVKSNHINKLNENKWSGQSLSNWIKKRKCKTKLKHCQQETIYQIWGLNKLKVKECNKIKLLIKIKAVWTHTDIRQYRI